MKRIISLAAVAVAACAIALITTVGQGAAQSSPAHLTAATYTQDYNEIENTMGRYAALGATLKTSPQQLNEFDLNDPHVRFAINKGPGSPPAIVGPSTLRTFWAGFAVTIKKNGGTLGEHVLTTPVISISKNGQTAKGEWQDLGTTMYGPGTMPATPPWPDGSTYSAVREVARYDGTFANTPSGWKITSLTWTVLWQYPAEEVNQTTGWIAHTSSPLPKPPSGN